MIQEYQYVYEVYKEKSFTNAAKNLFISQPSLSASIKKIEERLGYKIFNRNGIHLSLTQEGELYIQAAEKILETEKELQTSINDLRMLESGSISIAGSALYSSCVIPYIINTFTELYPKITVNMLEADSMLLYEEALKDHVELIIDAGDYDEENFMTEPLFREHMLLAIPQENPIIDLKNLSSIALTAEDIMNNRHLNPDFPAIDLSILKNEHFVLLKTGHDLHERAVNLCQEAGFTPKCSFYFNQLMTAYFSSSKGLGCCFITDTIIKHSHTTAPLMYFRLNPVNAPLAQREVFIAYRKNYHVTQAMQKFIHTGSMIRVFD